ncbi:MULTISPECIES: hypothetical protein [Geobacillus]|nr:hypothetical protein [Geobacillus stearothermophilus]
MFSRQIVFFVWQDLLLHRTVIRMILGVMALLMVVSILPLGMVVVGKWHSLKDFILLYRYEFFHLPVFLFLLGSTVNYHFISEQKRHFFAHSFRKPSPLF